MKVEKVEGHLYFSECAVRLDYYIGVTLYLTQQGLLFTEGGGDNNFFIHYLELRIRLHL